MNFQGHRLTATILPVPVPWQQKVKQTIGRSLGRSVQGRTAAKISGTSQPNFESDSFYSPIKLSYSHALNDELH